MWQWLKGVFRKNSFLEPEDVERLRVDFRDRYQSFKLLLSANNRALEVMAGMEQALCGDRHFGMQFIRASCTTVSVNVYRMIRNLDRLAPGKYGELLSRYEAIRREIEALLSRRTAPPDTRLIVPLDLVDRGMTDLVGAKMVRLGEIRRQTGVRIPPGFVITSAAYERFMGEQDLQAEIDRRLQAADSGDIQQFYALSTEIQQLIMRSELPETVQHAIREAWTALEHQEEALITVAMRSSALGEDAPGTSFAGLYRSELNVSKENAFHAYKQIVASKYSLQAMQYRLNRGVRDEDIAMCVGCMAMVNAAAGGVVYSRNPVDVRDDAVYIHSAWGLPKLVVDGSGPCDLFVVSRARPSSAIQRQVQTKPWRYECFPEEGVGRSPLDPETADQPSIDEDLARRLAELAIRLEGLHGTPQDIEWAVDKEGNIYFLQTRPLQTLASPGEADRKGGEAMIVRGGVTASPGAAAGSVRLVQRSVDVLDFPTGAVLLTRLPLPRWASLLDRAAAVVTEQGGFAGHLANVAREFGVPALFGVPEALSRLEGEDLVTVDASGKAVHRGRVDALLEAAPDKKNLMSGSPVLETLSDVCTLVVPLTLLDPGSPQFRPSGCRTLHDITRFVHERAVHEMFNFGKDHEFAERSSKQLFHKVPMQWWVLNLDDGFREEVEGRYVHLENIASIPMLAFWRGFTAIPWDGPPAVDGRGLISVMFQSTANTALTPGGRSRFAEKNYFMISKHFLSLNSRLGYHFSILEALVGDRPSENYVSFQFKGGAADLDRRIKRIEFIGSILEDHGFRVQVTEDHLSARLEGEASEAVEKRLEILGYLTLHTRQIDMIMSNPARVRFHEEEIRNGIERLLLH